MIAIELKTPHTHAGTAYPAGAVLEVDTPTADWLVAQGVGRPVSESKPTPAPAARRRGPTGVDDHE